MATKKKAVAKKKVTPLKGEIHRSQFSIGFKVQADQYEPVDIWASETIEYSGAKRDVDSELIKAVNERLEKKVVDIMLHVGEMKQKIIDELSDEDK